MANDIQFDEVQRPAGSTACTSCRSALFGQYFQINGQVICEQCAEKIRRMLYSKEGMPLRLLKAAIFGIGGGIAGGILYAFVLGVIHINAALITILIGWMVGKMARKGAGGRGGLGYQIIAVLITYLCIGFFATLSEMFGPDAAGDGPLQKLFICIFGAFVTPVYSATHSPLSGLITFFGLMQAWRFTKAADVSITGPHALAWSAPKASAPDESFAPPPPPPAPAPSQPEPPNAPSA